MDLKEIEKQLHFLSARATIQDKIALYGLGQDLHQTPENNNVLEQWSHMFADDAVIDMSQTQFGLGSLSVREYAAWMRGAKPGDEGQFGAWKAWQHIQGHASITFESETAATSIALFFHTHESHDSLSNTLAAGYWHDRWENRDGDWRIVNRRVQMLYFQTLAAVEMPENFRV